MRNLKTSEPLEIFHPQSREEWRNWLSENHQTSAGIWLVIAKKNSPQRNLSLEDAVEEALCFGWIDSQQKPLNEQSYRLIFTPRRPKSIWAKSNKQRIEKLIEQGRMTQAGLEKIEAAKKDGSWNILDDVEALKLPADLSAALTLDPIAQENFESFKPSAKKQLLWWIQSAKRQETRAKRIAQTVAAAKQGKAIPYME